MLIRFWIMPSVTTKKKARIGRVVGTTKLKTQSPLFWLVSKPLSPPVVIWTPRIGSRSIHLTVRLLIRIWTQSVISQLVSVKRLATLARQSRSIKPSIFISLNQQGASAPTFLGANHMSISTDTLKTRAAEYQVEIRAGYNLASRNGVPRNAPLQNTLNFINGEICRRERVQK